MSIYPDGYAYSPSGQGSEKTPKFSNLTGEPPRDPERLPGIGARPG